MLQQVLTIIFLILTIVAGIILIYRFREINRYFQQARGITSFKPVPKDFYILTDNVKNLDIESKARLMQQIIGNKIEIVVECTSQNMCIKGCLTTDYDIDKMIRHDRSIL